MSALTGAIQRERLLALQLEAKRLSDLLDPRRRERLDHDTGDHLGRVATQVEQSCARNGSQGNAGDPKGQGNAETKPG
jgi:hypothetical protein